MTMHDKIEIYCRRCDALNYIDDVRSVDSHSIKCVRCGAKIYWHVCSECDTGFYSHEKNEPCPECSAECIVKPPLQISLFRKILSKSCPWCSEPVFFAGFVETRGEGRCPYCRKFYSTAHVFRSVFMSLGFLLAAGLLLEKLGGVVWVKQHHLVLPFYILFILTEIFIFIKLVRLKK
jgi:hypothetical protein